MRHGTPRSDETENNVVATGRSSLWFARLADAVGLTFQNVHGNGVTDRGMFLRSGETDAAVVIESSTVCK
jgi:hypothetical protein